MLDFSKSVDDPVNRLNLMRIMAGVLSGKCVRFSTSDKNFGGAAFPIIHDEVIFEFTNLGVRQVRYQLSASEMIVEQIFNDFLSATTFPLPHDVNELYFRLPYADPHMFFDLLFAEKFGDPTSVKSKFVMVNRYIDFVKLDKLMKKDDSWGDFLRSVDIKPNKDYDPATIKINTPQQLEFFVKAILRKLDGTPIEYSLGDIDSKEDKDETGPYIAPDQYQVHPEFYKALRMYRYLG